MLKGLVLTPPVIGRISIGKVVERNGKRLPEKDDEFTLTSQIQTKEGWIKHPLDETLRQASGGKLRVIPIKLLFNDPDLNFRAQYSLFDRSTGRPICVGNGESCRRVCSSVNIKNNQNGMQQLDCPSPSLCDIGKNGHCKPYGRMNIRIGDDDELGSFIFRTTGFNSIRTLMTRLRYFDAVSGHLLSTLPLALRLRGKSTIQSFKSTIYYVDLTLPENLTLNEAIQMAKEADEQRKVAGFDQHALDEAARLGFNAGVFEETEEDGVSVVEEFYADINNQSENHTTGTMTMTGIDMETDGEINTNINTKNRLDQPISINGNVSTVKPHSTLSQKLSQKSEKIGIQ